MMPYISDRGPNRTEKTFPFFSRVCPVRFSFGKLSGSANKMIRNVKKATPPEAKNGTEKPYGLRNPPIAGPNTKLSPIPAPITPMPLARSSEGKTSATIAVTVGNAAAETMPPRIRYASISV